MGIKRSRQPQSPARRTAPVPEGYEHSDVSFGWIAGLVLFLAIAGIAMHFVLRAWLDKLAQKPRPRDKWTQVTLGPLMPIQGRGAVPQLQLQPSLDLEKFRAREEQELNSYGWVDRKAGLVHIPIERAMELVIKEQSPASNAGAKD